jgi:hypothetical protein
MLIKVSTEVSVATIESIEMGQGKFRPPKK